MTNLVRAGTACCAALLFLVGCGEDNPNFEGTVVLTHTEVVRSWLEEISRTGELDSGVIVMEEEISQLKEEGVENTDEITAAFNELKNATNPAAVRSHAQEMLRMLPPPPTVSRTEG